MNTIDRQLIAKAATGDLDTLCILDEHGLIIGRDENATKYAERLTALADNIDLMEQSLAEKGIFTVEGTTVSDSNRIPAPLFSETQAESQRLFGFAIDWVPGFFITPPGVFFGGCAFYFFPDFFALFIIRESFRNREKWLIYSRLELLAHELCHVGRVGLESQIYEEMLAYQTASSPFRKLSGAIFRTPGDSFLFLGSTLLLLIAQIAKTVIFSGLWIWPFWGFVAGVICFLILRLGATSQRFRKALAALEHIAGTDALKILYRCTDAEINYLADVGDSECTRSWIAARGEDIRWAVIQRRFLNVTRGASPSDLASNGLGNPMDQ